MLQSLIKVTSQLIARIWHLPSVHFGPCVARSNCPNWICGRGTDPWQLVRPLALSQDRFIPDPYREHSGKLLKNYVTEPELDNFVLLKHSFFAKNVKHSIRIMIARWALFGRADLVIFCAVCVELMSLVLLCCQSTTSTQIQSIMLPSQAERWQPLFHQHVCCAQNRNLNTHTAVGRTHKPHMLTHIQASMCTDPKMHTHTLCHNSC